MQFLVLTLFVTIVSDITESTVILVVVRGIGIVIWTPYLIRKRDVLLNKSEDGPTD